MMDQFLLLLTFLPFALGMAMSNQEKSQVRSRVLGRLKDEVEAIDTDENDIIEFAVKVRDTDLLRVLVNKQFAWKDYRDEFGMEGVPYNQTKEFKEIVRKYTTLTTGEAVEKEKWAMLKYLTASAEQPRARDLKLVKWLIKDINRDRDDPYLQYLAGNMGNGKTDFALLIAEIWQDITGGTIVTNIESCKNAVFVAGQDELDEWLDKNPNKKFIFVFDEASDTADGRGDSTAVTAQLSPFLKYIRKNDGNMIIIGHTGKDVHAEVRRLCDFIQKESKKVARFFKSVDEDGNGEGLKKTFRGIPPTTLEYDTNEDSDWSWSDEMLQRCLGTNSNGDWCGSRFDTENGRVLCDTHQHQDEPHPDVPDSALEGTKFEDFMSEDTDDEEEPEDEETPALPAADVDDEEEEESDENRTDDDEIESETSTSQNTVDDSPESSEQSEAMEDENEGGDLDEVPDQYWDIVEDRTGGAYTRDNVDSLEQLEQLLNNTQWNRLQSQLED
ncbi:AAA family ATPase [Haloterrigena salifodinae]|uniref:AAA family ATPase n=1 Tax=Haloterrigena salifodinae TaxID=2675099 RepID=A0A8T8E3H8_9EURY|nr:AAA family ATPase [Haloterrigena salifodinae]QRV16030.1 AAA family ATPase [Haloterrigena salifodinae]